MMLTVKLQNFLHRIVLAGGGFLAYTISALQTTILSLHIAHNCSQKFLAVFSFLLSCLYFSVQLLRRNVIEPFYHSKLSSIVNHNKLQIIGIMLFSTFISGITAYITDLYKLSFCLMLLTFSTLFWEIRKAVLRKAKLVVRYSIIELIILVIMAFVILGNLLGYVIDPESTIILLLILHIISIYISKGKLTTISKVLNSPESETPSRSYSLSEYTFVLTIMVSNLWLLSAGYANEIGEIRAVFLLLTISTFSIGALRNSLAMEMKLSSINSLLFGAILLNITIVYLMPADFVQKLIPSVSDNFRYLLIPVSLDLIGSLIFVVYSLKLIREKNMTRSSEARFISAFFIVLTLCIIDRSDLNSLSIAYVYGVSSISAALYLSLIRRKILF